MKLTPRKYKNKCIKAMKILIQNHGWKEHDFEFVDNNIECDYGDMYNIPYNHEDNFSLIKGTPFIYTRTCFEYDEGGIWTCVLQQLNQIEYENNKSKI